MYKFILLVFYAIVFLFSQFTFAQSLYDLVDMNSPQMTESEMSREQLISKLEHSPPGLDLTDKSFSNLDLSGIDF